MNLETFSAGLRKMGTFLYSQCTQSDNPASDQSI